MAAWYLKVAHDFLWSMVVAVFYWKSCMKWISLQVMYAYYHDCDPMTTRQVNKKDQLFPLFVMQVNNIFITKLVNLVDSNIIIFTTKLPKHQVMKDYPGVPGLFVAGVFSGALSTGFASNI